MKTCPYRSLAPPGIVATMAPSPAFLFMQSALDFIRFSCYGHLFKESAHTSGKEVIRVRKEVLFIITIPLLAGCGRTGIPIVDFFNGSETLTVLQQSVALEMRFNFIAALPYLPLGSVRVESWNNHVYVRILVPITIEQRTRLRHDLDDHGLKDVGILDDRRR